MRPYSFFYHYNKPLSQRRGIPQVSVHWRGQCIIADNVVVNVPTRWRVKTRQPRFVVAGKAKSVDVINGVAFIS